MNAPVRNRFPRALALGLALLSGAAAASPLSAQSHALDRGSLILAGSAGISSISTGDGRQTLAAVSPQVQYFVSPGFALGGQAELNYLSFDGASHTSIAAGPEATYYFGPGEKVLYPFVSAGATVGRGGGETVYSSELSAGVLRMLSRSVGLQGRVYHQLTRGAVDWDAIGFAFGFSAFTF